MDAAARQKSLRERLRTVCAWSALALVAWQAAEGSIAVAGELFGEPLERHLRLFHESPEELIRSTLGADFELWLALREHVPADACVRLSCRQGRDYYSLLRRLTKLGALAYPITMRGWPYDPARPLHDREANSRSELVLDLDSGRDFTAWASCEELARGPGYRLLRIGNAEAGAGAR